MKANKILIIIALTLNINTSKAQILRQFIPEIYLTPAVTIGYTFRCGWNYGIDLTLAFTRIENTLPHTTLGVNMQYYLINYQSEQHHVTAFNIVVDNAITQFGAGIGMVSKSWGYKRVNKDAAIGGSIIFNMGANNYRLPWLGVKAFVPSNNWTWSSLPYYISYSFFWRQEPISLR